MEEHIRVCQSFPEVFSGSGGVVAIALGSLTSKPDTATCTSWIQATHAALTELQTAHFQAIKELYVPPPSLGAAPLQPGTCPGARSSPARSPANGSAVCPSPPRPPGTAPSRCCSASPRPSSLVCPEPHKGNDQNVTGITYDIQVRTC